MFIHKLMVEAAVAVALVLLDKAGNVVTADGRAKVMGDQKGETIAAGGWAPKPLPSPSRSPLPLSSPSPAPQSWAFYSGECPAGQRRASSSECSAAVQEAARFAGVEVRGRKNVDDGAAVFVPPGCSYSAVSKMAIFNVNPLGTRGEAYQYVCTAKPNALLQPKSAATSHATAAAQPTSDLERDLPIHQPRDTRGEDSGEAGSTRG